jgi:hypothetical protein
MLEYLLYVHLAIIIIGVVIHKIYFSGDTDFNVDKVENHETLILVILSFGLGYWYCNLVNNYQ